MDQTNIQPNTQLNGQTPPTQPPPTTVQPPATQQDDAKYSSKLETLIRREAQARAAEEQAKLATKDYEEFKKLKSQFDEAKKGNFKKALELLGTDYNTLTQSMLNEGEIPPQTLIKELKDEIQAMKQEREAEKQTLAEKAKEQETNQLKQIEESTKSKLLEFAKSNPDRYELVIFDDAKDAIYAKMEEHYEKTKTEDKDGEILTEAQACDLVEKELEEQLIKTIQTKKAQALIAQMKGQRSGFVNALKQDNKPQTPKTLTNQMQPGQPTQKKGYRTDEQRIQDAIAFAKNLRP